MSKSRTRRWAIVWRCFTAAIILISADLAEMILKQSGFEASLTHN